MEAVRERFETRVVTDEKGTTTEVSDRRVGKPETFEFGAPDDVVTQVVKGGYIKNWKPDFFSSLHEYGVVARFYYDTRIAVDIGNPDSKLARKKRRLLHKNGFAYFCISPGYPEDAGQLLKLLQAAIQEYREYEKVNPRPIVYQEGIIIGEDGNPRTAKVRAIDIDVGGKVIGSTELQAQDLLRTSQPLSKADAGMLRRNAALYEHVRKCLTAGHPFRNPFVARKRRQFDVDYEAVPA